MSRASCTKFNQCAWCVLQRVAVRSGIRPLRTSPDGATLLREAAKVRRSLISKPRRGNKLAKCVVYLADSGPAHARGWAPNRLELSGPVPVRLTTGHVVLVVRQAPPDEPPTNMTSDLGRPSLIPWPMQPRTVAFFAGGCCVAAMFRASLARPNQVAFFVFFIAKSGRHWIDGPSEHCPLFPDKPKISSTQSRTCIAFAPQIPRARNAGLRQVNKFLAELHASCEPSPKHTMLARLFFFVFWCDLDAAVLETKLCFTTTTTSVSRTWPRFPKHNLVAKTKPPFSQNKEARCFTNESRNPVSQTIIGPCSNIELEPMFQQQKHNPFPTSKQL